MRCLIILILLLKAVSPSFSQTVLPFGKPDIQELRMKECAFEKDAAVMKLIDYQETEMTIMGVDLKIQIERRVRIKIFNKNGFDAANIIIPYIRRNKKSKITDITAYIYNIDPAGNIITQKLEKNQIFKEKSDEGINTVAFTFPNLQPGSVIEYRYTHNEKNSLHLDPWYFQDKIPTGLSVCKFIYPNGMKFDFRFITTDSVVRAYENKYSRNIRTFTLKHINAFRVEPMMSSVKDNLQRVEFALVPRLGTFDRYINDRDRWKFYNMVLLFSSFFGEQIHTNIPGTENIIDSAKKNSSLSGKVHYIYQQVKHNIKWDETQSFYADDLDEVWKSKSANSAEINLTILNLLLKSGIKCYPLLISTRDNGRPDPNFISLGQFNSVNVLVVDTSQFYVLDGTQKYISFKTPPYNILNREVFLVDTLNSKWLNIADDRPLMKTSVAVKAELKKSGQLTGDAFISYYDHSKALKLDEQNEKDNEKDDDKEFIEKESADLVIDSLLEENADDELLPLIHKFSFEYKLSKTDDYYFLDPFFLSNFRKNPFRDSLRRTNIDMGSNQSYTMYLQLTIADEYEIEELPKNILIRANDSSMLFTRQVLQQENILVYRNSFEIQRAIFDREEYPGIREFFLKIYSIIGDQIVLKKKK